MSDTMIAIGGCHVAGYKVGEENSFVNVISKVTGSILSHRAPRYQIKRTNGIREKINKSQPDVVLLQLGNYEFNSSLRQIVKNKPVSEGAQYEYSFNTEQKYPKKPLVLPLISEKKRYHFFQNLLSPFIWSYLACKNYKHLNNIRHIIKENPGTKFIILSPMPCLNASDNFIRRNAAKWFKIMFKDMPNVKFINLFKYISVDKRYFEDPAHLNITGHRILGKIVSQYIKSFKITADVQRPLAIAV